MQAATSPPISCSCPLGIDQLIPCKLQPVRQSAVLDLCELISWCHSNLTGSFISTFLVLRWLPSGKFQSIRESAVIALCDLISWCQAYWQQLVNQLFSCPAFIAQWQVLISPQISCSCPLGTVQLMQGILQPTRKSAVFLSGVDYSSALLVLGLICQWMPCTATSLSISWSYLTLHGPQGAADKARLASPQVWKAKTSVSPECTMIFVWHACDLFDFALENYAAN